jgi:hypothetical protein
MPAVRTAGADPSAEPREERERDHRDGRPKEYEPCQPAWPQRARRRKRREQQAEFDAEARPDVTVLAPGEQAGFLPVPSASGSRLQVPSIGCGPSTTWMRSRLGRSNSENSVICSNSLAPSGGFVRSRKRLASPGGPAVSGSIDRLEVCYSPSFEGSARESNTTAHGRRTWKVSTILTVRARARTRARAAGRTRPHAA